MGEASSEDEAYRQSLDDEGWQVCTLSSPLLLGISLDETLVDIFTDEHLSLFLQIARLTYTIGLHFSHGFCLLLINFSLCFCWSSKARPAFAARTSTCAGSPPWWPKCT